MSEGYRHRRAPRGLTAILEAILAGEPDAEVSSPIFCPSIHE
jgi:hypothetical protein